MGRTDDVVWVEFVESKIFSKQIGALPAEVLINIQSELVQNPQRGDIVKGTHGVRKAERLTQAHREARAVATDICISTSNTPAEFICCIYSAKVTKPTHHRIKRASLAR